MKRKTTNDVKNSTTKSRKKSEHSEKKETYKSWEILEAGTIKQVEMKEKIKKEYFRRKRTQLVTKLHSRNLIKGVNTWAVLSSKILRTILKVDEGRTSTNGSENKKGKLITATRNNTNNTSINRTKITKMGGKQLHWHLKRQTSEISREKTWIWPWKVNLKKETEYLLIAAQNNSLRTNYVKAKIDKTQQNSRWRLCSDRDETINHLISDSSK